MRDLKELEQEVRKYNVDPITIYKGGKPNKKSLIDFLREKNMPEGGLPYPLVSHPMLCWPYTTKDGLNVTDALDREIWRDNSNYIFEKKFNGCRMILYIMAGKGNYATGRNISVVTYRNEDYTEHLLFKNHNFQTVCILDSEVLSNAKTVDTRPYSPRGVVTQTSLHASSALLALRPESSIDAQKKQNAHFIFNLFDILYIDGNFITHQPWIKRRALLEDVFKVLDNSLSDTFRLSEVVKTNKRNYYNSLLELGEEGSVTKDINSPYEASTSRKRYWIKMKKSLEVDAFVSGFIPGDKGFDGLVGALKFSIYVQKEDGSIYKHWIASTSNIPLELRKKISVKKDGVLRLDPSYYGKVAEISFQEISSRELRGVHSRLVRWREGSDGKDADQCIIPESFLMDSVGSAI